MGLGGDDALPPAALTVPCRRRHRPAAGQSMDKARTTLPAGTRVRVLFSAHGLPESIVRGGDPYQFQVERTVDAVRDALAMPDLDWVICYQSRVTPEPWLAPSTEAEIERAAHDGVAAVVVPIAFVSEHSETLVELDVEYGNVARELGISRLFPGAGAERSSGVHRRPRRDRAACAGAGAGLCSYAGGRVCPDNLRRLSARDGSVSKARGSAPGPRQGHSPWSPFAKRMSNDEHHFQGNRLDNWNEANCSSPPALAGEGEWPLPRDHRLRAIALNRWPAPI